VISYRRLAECCYQPNTCFRSPDGRATRLFTTRPVMDRMPKLFGIKLEPVTVCHEDKGSRLGLKPLRQSNANFALCLHSARANSAGDWVVTFLTASHN
jgi:hypothetical protein